MQYVKVKISVNGEDEFTEIADCDDSTAIEPDSFDYAGIIAAVFAGTALGAYEYIFEGKAAIGVLIGAGIGYSIDRTINKLNLYFEYRSDHFSKD